MLIDVTIEGTGGPASVQQVRVSRLQFIKHLALAGMDNTPRFDRLLRTIGALLFFSPYLGRNDYDSNRFSDPSGAYRDPTAKAQFSNLVGRAFADLLVRRFFGAIHVAGYESAMEQRGLPISGARPDLLASTPTEQIAVEAKGYSRASVTDLDMKAHKVQAESGPIVVQRAAACVSYALYTSAACRLRDPVLSDSRPTPEERDATIGFWYRALWATIGLAGAGVVRISDHDLAIIAPPFGLARPATAPESLLSGSVALVADVRTREWGARRSELLLVTEQIDVESLFLDTDGVGVLAF
jgi:hypothetical protein